MTEVTCLSIAKVIGATELPDDADGKARHYGLLNDAIFEASRKKTLQCADTGHPVLVAVGTFHFQASALCFSEHHLQMLLTGEELITQRIDTRTGQSVGDIYLSTKLWSATFLRPDNETGMEHARCPISAMLLCGFGCHPFQVGGVLHPRPVHDFDHLLLPDVKFCRLKEGYESGQFSTEWV